MTTALDLTPEHLAALALLAAATAALCLAGRRRPERSAVAAAAALFLVIGLRIVPRPGAWARAALVTAAYSAAVGLVDVLSGGDYLYLRRPPLEPSLLDLMGPWPWYLVSSEVLAIELFLLLQA